MGKKGMSDPAKIIVMSPDELEALVVRAVAQALEGSQKTAAPKDWLRADELANVYGLPKTWFEERGRAGDIARTKPGRYVLFKRRDVEAYLEDRRTINGDRV